MSANDDSYKVSISMWQTIKMMTDILHEPYKLTIELQRQNYTLSDFFGDLMKTKRNLQTFSHELGISIVKNIEKREERILNNKLMVSAVYLDPRYNILLSTEQKNDAVIYLSQIWCKLSQISPPETSIDGTEKEPDDFADYLKNVANTHQPTDITSRIEAFIHRPSIHYRTNIIEYWNTLKLEEPDLFKLATALFSVAVTQVDVERSFSSLKFIFNDYRSRLESEILSQLLILRLNYSLAPDVNDFSKFGVEGNESEFGELDLE